MCDPAGNPDRSVDFLFKNKNIITSRRRKLKKPFEMIHNLHIEHLLVKRQSFVDISHGNGQMC